jgi:hypothetical protein
LRRSVLILALALLTACGDRTQDDTSRAASGEVLAGTISDEMLPLDRVRSQPPLAEQEGTQGAGRTSASPARGASEPEEDGAAANEPAGEAEAD